jgi:hypothetical protein
MTDAYVDDRRRNTAGITIETDGIAYFTQTKTDTRTQSSPLVPKARLPELPPIQTPQDHSGAHGDELDCPFTNWRCLLGDDLPDLDDDDEFSVSSAFSESDDESTLDAEERLPQDMCWVEEAVLLQVFADMPLPQVRRLLNVPSDLLDPAPSQSHHMYLTTLTVRCGDVVLKSVLQDGYFAEVEENQAMPAPTPLTAADRMFLLFQGIAEQVAAGYYEDAIRAATCKTSISAACDEVADKVARLEKLIKRSGDGDFLLEPKLQKSKQQRVRSIARTYETAEKEAQPLAEDPYQLEHTTLMDALVFRPDIRRIHDAPMVPIEGVDFATWKRRNTYFALLRLHAALTFLRHDDPLSKEAEKRKLTYLFVTKRLPLLNDDLGLKDREQALGRLAADKDHVIRSIGQRAWDELFPPSPSPDE